MPEATGGATAHNLPKRRKVESSASPSELQISEDKTVADFVRFCYLDDEHHEPKLDADSYIMQFCQLVRMELRNGHREYVLDVLRVTTSEGDLDHSRKALERLLKQPKYDHLNGIDFVRAKMGAAERERAAVQYELDNSSGTDSESKGTVEPGMVIGGSRNLHNILKDAETKTVVIAAINRVPEGEKLFDAARDIQKTHPRWNNDTSLNQSLKRWILNLVSGDAAALGFTDADIRDVQNRIRGR